MGLSSSSSKTQSQSNSTSTASPYAAAQPGIDTGLAGASSVFGANVGNAASLASSLSDAYSALAPGAFSTNPYVAAAQTGASSIINGGTNNNPGAAAYSSILGSTNPALAGLAAVGNGTGSLGAGDATLQSFTDPNNANPYLDAITSQATGAAQKAVNQRFGASGLGAGLSSSYDAALGSAVADANNSTRYTAYNDAANRALTAANDLSTGSRADAATRLGALGTLGSQYTAGQQTDLAAGQAQDASYNAQQQAILSALGLTGQLTDAQYAGVQPLIALGSAAASAPYANIDQYANALNALAGKYGTTISSGTSSGTTTTDQGLGLIAAGLGGSALSGWALGGFK